MFDYNQIMSILFIIFGAFFLLTGKGNISQRILALLALLMPVTGYLSGLSISEILIHIAIGFGGLIVGFLYFIFVVKKGGLVKAFTVLVLWLPIDSLVPVITSLLIVGFLIALIDVLIMKISSSDKAFLTNHYTALLIIVAGIIMSPTFNIPILY